ncbi:MAG: serine/threonine protein kinase [Planctomycetota bacterium]|nr:MAG: serine/threonine protein kinase [Planctomycetota bacterium]
MWVVMGTVDWQRVQGAGLLDEVLASDAVSCDIGDRYEVGVLIGSGGQGNVYRARDCLLARDVAVKLVHQSAANRHLQAEAALLARLSHPAIPSVYDRGVSVDGRAYMVMELIDGQPLKRVIDDPQWPLRERLRVFRAVASAVAHAHERGILHRDCKPGNIALRDDGEAFLLDWGLAATGDPRAICGTPCYAAPEQLSGQVADRRSDVYSLGVLLYQVISGHLPFARVVHDFAEFRAQRAGLGLVPLRRYRSDLRPSFQRVIDRAMAAQPAARYERCNHLIEDIDALIAGERVSLDPYHWRLPRWLLPSIAAGLVAFALGWWWSPSGLARPDWPATQSSSVRDADDVVPQPFADAPPAMAEAPWDEADEDAFEPSSQQTLSSLPITITDVEADGVADLIAPSPGPIQAEPAMPPQAIMEPRQSSILDPSENEGESGAGNDWSLLRLPTLDDITDGE